MEYAFIIDLLPKYKSVFGIELITSETAIEVDGEVKDRVAYTFLVGLAIIHFQFIVFKKVES